MRRKSNDRLEAIAEAALKVFTERGYRQTQMSEVAAAAGVSSGSLYGYVENKEALLKLAILAATGRMTEVGDLPLPCEGLEDVIAVLRNQVRSDMQWPELSATGGRHKPADEALQKVLREVFAILSRSRRLIWLLDRLALELPDFRKVHYEELKLPYLRTLAGFLEDERLSADLMPDLLARGVLEFVAWFAMHRHRDALLPKVSDEDAFAMVETVLLRGLSAKPG